MYCSRIACLAAVLFSLFALCACSGQKVLTSDELRSELFSANSYASEVETFIDYVRHGKATNIFAEAHARQLEKEITHSEQELAGASPQPPDTKAFESCKSELELLRHELPIIPTLMGNDDALRAEGDKLAAKHHELALAASTI